MATLTPISLGVRSNPSRHSKQAGNVRHINCFAEEIGEEGKSPTVITAVAGLSNFGSTLSGASGGIRDMIEGGDGALYVIAGRQVYKVLADATSTLIGGVPTDGPVYMRRNRRVPTQIGIVSDGYFAVIDTGIVSQVQDPDLPPPTSLAYLDGYGILPTSRGRFFLTGIDDFTTVSALDQAVAESNPDDVLRAHELGREIVLFGSRSIEWWQHTGKADFPFERSQANEIGCLAADSVAPFDLPGGRTLIWVAHDHSVRLMQGYGGQVISTGEIENLIRMLDEAGNASTLKATSWSWAGRSFYALSCASWTRVFNGKGWHERSSYGSARWKVSKVVAFAGKLIAGNSASGQLYQMKDDTFAEGSDPLIMEIVAPPVHAFPYRGRANALHIDAATGVGLNTTAAQNLDPVLMLDWSKDGGDHYATARELALGRLGATATRVKPEYRLGSFGQKGLTFRFRISAAVQKLIIGASLDFDRLAA